MTEGPQQEKVVRGTRPELEVGCDCIQASVHHAAASVNVGTMKKLRGVDYRDHVSCWIPPCRQLIMDDSLAARRAWHMML